MKIPIYYTDIQQYDLTDLQRQFSGKLSELIFENAHLYKNEKDKLRHLLGQILSRYAIYLFSNQVYPNPFLTHEKGKPYIEISPNCYFNISHSKDKVVVGISASNIGVDIEYIRKGKLNVAKRFFSEKEIQVIEQSENIDMAFTQYWSLKEAYLKYIGTGLTKPLSSFYLQKSHQDKWKIYANHQGIKDVSLYHQVIESNYHLSVCGATDMDELLLVEVKKDELLDMEHWKSITNGNF